MLAKITQLVVFSPTKVVMSGLLVLTLIAVIDNTWVLASNHMYVADCCHRVVAKTFIDFLPYWHNLWHSV